MWQKKDISPGAIPTMIFLQKTNYKNKAGL